MNTGATNMNNKHIERSTSTPQADAAPSEAKRGTDAQILFERELTVSAINGAMAFGHQNTNPPPSDDHWLAPFWKIGRKQAELEAAIAAGGAQEPSATLVKCRDMKGAEWFDIKVHDRSLPDGAKLYAAPLANEASKPAAPVGWRFNVGSSDDRIWLTVTTPYGASASLSCAGRHDNGRTIQGQVLMALQEALDAPAAPSVEQDDEREAFKAAFEARAYSEQICLGRDCGARAATPELADPIAWRIEQRPGRYTFAEHVENLRLYAGANIVPLFRTFHSLDENINAAFDRLESMVTWEPRLLSGPDAVDRLEHINRLLYELLNPHPSSAASTSANVAQGAVAPDGRVVDKAMVKRLAVQYGLLPEQTADVAQGAQPAVVLDDEQAEEIEECREILSSLIQNIKEDGHYSVEATFTFIQQAINCLPAKD
jgi:hypothetical protein